MMQDSADAVSKSELSSSFFTVSSIIEYINMIAINGCTTVGKMAVGLMRTLTTVATFE